MRRMKIIEAQFTMQTALAEADTQQKQKKLEEGEKDQAVDNQQKSLALANVAVAAHANKPNGVSLVPTRSNAAGTSLPTAEHATGSSSRPR